MTPYPDTNVAVCLAQGGLGRITAAARAQLESSELLLSPMVLLEFGVSIRSRPHTVAVYRSILGRQNVDTFSAEHRVIAHGLAWFSFQCALPFRPVGGI